MNFLPFKLAVRNQFNAMSSLPAAELYVTDTDKDAIYQAYLSSFPEGTNPMFRERTEHDCSCCRSFIRQAGNVVAIVDNKLVSIWDIVPDGIDEGYLVVAKALSEYVKSKPIVDVFRHDQSAVGTDQNREQVGEQIKTWNHFYAEVPNKFVLAGVSQPAFLGERRDNFSVLKRSVEEISDEAVEIVLDLMSQNTLYRGAEFKAAVTNLKQAKSDIAKAENKDLALWVLSGKLGQSGRYRNTAIGTLLIDLSEGRDLEEAVDSYGKKVDPTNYKRSASLITPSMVKSAEATVVELGLQNALTRRLAVEYDLTINNVLFADRSIKPALGGVLGDLTGSMKPANQRPNMDNVEEISIDSFLANVLPKAESLEVMMESQHVGNLVSLISPIDKSAPNILKWNNNFSWSYRGEVTDSIVERVKAAGGNVEGDVVLSLSWFNRDDLDFHLITPKGEVYFSQRERAGFNLDVDMNNWEPNISDTPVENIFARSLKNVPSGNYELRVHNYRKRESHNVGFQVRCSVLGDVNVLSHVEPVRDSEVVPVLKMEVSGGTVTSMDFLLPADKSTRTEWGVTTNQWTKVKMVMLSPNFWDGQEVGNKHWFFMLDNCVNPESARGFYNEFLRPELYEHRKVFEILSSKMKASIDGAQQLSGLGFSSTLRKELLVRVGGSFNRVLKVKF